MRGGVVYAATNIFLGGLSSTPMPIAPHNGFHGNVSWDLRQQYKVGLAQCPTSPHGGTLSRILFPPFRK